MTEIEALADFFRAAFYQMREGFDWDGGDMQAVAAQSGLILMREYDPITDQGMEASEGDTIFVLTQIGKAAIDRAKVASHG